MEASADQSMLKSPIAVGIALVVSGLAGFLYFEGMLALLFTGLNGSGAILILRQSQTNAATTLGTATVLGSWTVIGFVETAWPLAVATGIGFGWYTLIAESDVIGEAYRRRTTNEDQE